MGSEAASLVQKQEPVGPPPPAGFETYKKNAASGGVMDMIKQIIDDAKAMEAEALRNEADAQQAYESFVKETNASINAIARTSSTNPKLRRRRSRNLWRQSNRKKQFCWNSSSFPIT